jgi:hypothetical protein
MVYGFTTDKERQVQPAIDDPEQLEANRGVIRQTHWEEIAEKKSLPSFRRGW